MDYLQLKFNFVNLWLNKSIFSNCTFFISLLFPHGIMYSYQMQIISKQIYLTHRWDPNSPGQSESGSYGNEWEE